MANEFLLEVGTEEIPDWMLGGALADLKKRFLAVLEENALLDGVETRLEATPRRLVLIATGLADRQADRVERLSGPPKKIAFDADGNPTKAALGFAKRAGVDASELTVGDDGKLFLEKNVPGRATAQILAEQLPEVIAKIHFPKTMYWTGGGATRWIRPIRWLVALLAGDVVPFSVAGVHSGHTTHGHRRLGQSDFAVSSAAEFESTLAKNFVLLSAATRQQRIETEIDKLLPGETSVRKNDKLLGVLVNITEYPTPILGSFEEDFLALPEEVLETVMEHHQKYFAVEDANGKLLPEFVAVANLDADRDGIIRQGHERVLRARFNDARFFWDFDQKQKLADRVEDLKNVTFQAQLGSYYDKTQRNAELARNLAIAAGLTSDDVEHADRAAQLAKCDLTTEMVGEFPELQGQVGGLYAAHQGEPQAVADAIYDHYKPTGPADGVPRSSVGNVVAIADKLATLGGMFRIGNAPTGSRDPFALRRAALGIIRIAAESGLPYTIHQLAAWAQAGEHSPALEEFLADRLRYVLREVRGHAYDAVSAVLAGDDGDIPELAARVQAVTEVRETPDFEPLAVSFKRIRNILEKAGGVAQYAERSLDASLLETGAESQLHAVFEELKPRVESLKSAGQYPAALEAIASLRPTVDKFFDDVLVMAKDDAVRENRLTLLAHLLSEFSQVADFSEIGAA